MPVDTTPSDFGHRLRTDCKRWASRYGILMPSVPGNGHVLGGSPVPKRRPRKSGQPERLVVRLAAVILRQHPLEHRAGRRRRGEQSGAGPQLHVIWRPEDVHRRPALHREDRFGALDKPPPEDRMGEVSPGLLKALDRVIPGRWAMAQPSELWEDIPHPVRPLSPTSDLGQGRFKVLLLGGHEAVQDEWVIHDWPSTLSCPAATDRTCRLAY